MINKSPSVYENSITFWATQFQWYYNKLTFTNTYGRPYLVIFTFYCDANGSFQCGVGDSFCTDCGVDETSSIEVKYCNAVDIISAGATATTQVMTTQSTSVTINYKAVRL